MRLFKHDCAKHGHRFKARYDEVANESVANRLKSLEGI